MTAAASAMNVTYDVSLAKIRLPQPQYASVDRDRAFAALVDCLKWKVVIVEAPFGYAKTGLLAEACRRLDEGGSYRTAWVSADETDDNDRLVRHVLAALRTLLPDLDLAAFMDVYRNDRGNFDVALSNFLLDSTDGGKKPIVLFVDNLNRANRRVVSELLNSTARYFPDAVHVVAAGSRQLWESIDVALQGQVRLFPTELLSFTKDEVNSILSVVFERRSADASGAFASLPKLDEADVAKLAEELWEFTSGWPLAVRLYADSLSRGTVGFGSSVDERSLSKMLNRFFRRNLLDELPEDARRFVVTIALPDEVNAELCDELTGSNDSKFILRDLYLQGFFLKPIADRPGWYAFHPLFLRWLRMKQAQMPADELNDLCLVASDWHERHRMLPEAAKYLLMASDVGFIEGLTSAMGFEMQRGSLGYFEWISRIPAHRFALEPQLALQAAWGYLLKGRMEDGWKWVEAFERAARATDGYNADVIAMVVALARQKCFEFDCRYAEAVEMGEDLLRKYAGRLSVQQSCSLLHSMGDCYARVGRLDEALKCGLQAEVMAELGQSSFYLAMSQLSIIELYLVQGKMKEALALCDEALSADEDHAPFGAILSLKSRICVETGRLEEAEKCLDQAYRRMTPRHNVDMLYEIEADHAHYLSAAGRCPEAFRLITKTAFQIGGSTVARSIDLKVFLEQVLVTLSMGYTAEAAAAAETLRSRTGSEDVVYRLAWTAANCQTQDALGGGAPASELFGAIERAREVGAGYYELWLCVCAADRLARDGAHADAIMYLTRALRLQSGQHIVGPFLRAGGRIRALLHEIVDVRKSGGQVRQLAKAVLRHFGEGEAASDDVRQKDAPLARFGLTDREREVLELLDAGLSRREIADALSVSLNTVKSHVGHIYEKLGVTNRIDAFLIVHEE